MSKSLNTGKSIKMTYLCGFHQNNINLLRIYVIPAVVEVLKYHCAASGKISSTEAGKHINIQQY